MTSERQSIPSEKGQFTAELTVTVTVADISVSQHRGMSVEGRYLTVKP